MWPATVPWAASLAYGLRKSVGLLVTRHFRVMVQAEGLWVRGYDRLAVGRVLGRHFWGDGHGLRGQDMLVMLVVGMVICLLQCLVKVQAEGFGEAVLGAWAPWTGQLGGGEGHLLTAVHGDGCCPPLSSSGWGS